MSRLLMALAPLILAAGAAQAQDPHAGHAMPPAPHQPGPQPGRPAADPHAGHQAPVPAPPPAQTQNPHAGHVMPPALPTPAPDPHAGHQAPARPQAADPHAGHDMGATMGPPDIPTSADNPGRPPEDPVPAAALAGPTHAADAVFGPGEMTAARRVLLAENGDVRTTAVVIDRLEAGFADGEETWLWDVQGWTGGDINRFWWKTEGEGDIGGDLEEVELQALYSRAVTPFWDVQAGVRQDFRPDGEDLTHLVLGLQGLAPYWWEIDAAAFLSSEGDLTARIEAEYDQRITRRLILQPRLELDASASDIPELELGSGLSSVAAGLRLRYEFSPEFTPYVGVEWNRALGDTAAYIEARNGSPEAVRVIAGLRAWF